MTIRVEVGNIIFVGKALLLDMAVTAGAEGDTFSVDCMHPTITVMKTKK
jgi:hypothetical protein